MDLSVLGIEEDEDAEAEYLAGEGESPPGKKRRRNANARGVVSELMRRPQTLAPLVEKPLLAQGCEAMAFTLSGFAPLRLAGLPLRPRILFEPKQAQPVEAPAPVAKPADKAAASLAAAWSAKRLKKADPAAPAPATADSGPKTPVETPVARSEQLSAGHHLSAVQVKTSAPVVAPAKLSRPVLVKADDTAAKKQDIARKERAPADPQQSGEGPVTVFPNLPEKLAEALTRPEPAVTASSTVETLESPKAVESGQELKVEIQNHEAQPSEADGKASSNRAAKAQAAASSGAEVSKKSKKSDAKKREVVAAPLAAVELAPTKPPFEAPLLGAGANPSGSFWANLPVLPKIALALGIVIAVGGGAWITLNPSGKASTTVESVKKSQSPAKTGRSLMMNLPGGWSPDWGGDFNRKKNRTISLYRPSVHNDDYRMEFEGQVDSKGVGWVYRAVDQKNYFAYKVELVRTGTDPGAALTHFTVVDGVESQKHYSPLAKPIRPGASFRVRLDIRGDEFSAYVNDDLIEVWQDDRLPKGGFGIMTEQGEAGQIRKLQVFELLP